MFKKHTFVSKVAVIGMALGALSSNALAEEVWKIQSHLPTGHIVYQAEDAWVNNVNEMLGGRLRLELLPGGSVVAASETIDAMGYGIIDGDITSPAYFAGLDKGFAMLADLVGGYTNWTQAFAWCEFGGGKELFQEVYDNYDIHFVGCSNAGIESLIAKKPIRSVADFKGVKVRAPSGLASEIFSDMGAAPLNMGMADIYSALEKGVIDAADASSYVMNSAAGYHEVAKYPIVDFHSLPVLSMSVSKKKWDAQPKDIQQIITTAYRDLTVQINLSDMVSRGEIMEKDKTEGVEPIYWSAEEQNKMREIAKGVWLEASKESDLAHKAYESHVNFMKRLGLLE
ncbi:TRAP transporter substrate-binding protein DctP [Marinomonas rhizomae]|uniref:TRAP-type mannitol/chloroaromatic compound transport system substrate-binding protein n=1 Tax=Marinomonas rhizomae TaxID=491948 RepID=A0A366J9B0_9GAMM|nr:TRAP transporter substrate-binding protein DctP [Marinomonas rhizomae]RBP83447.1 TRAP-type mannitol/chloroaromatic compound transport system substrate-binding protein [Marinomonas rhizomae]